MHRKDSGQRAALCREGSPAARAPNRGREHKRPRARTAEGPSAADADTISHIGQLQVGLCRARRGGGSQHRDSVPTGRRGPRDRSVH